MPEIQPARCDSAGGCLDRSPAALVIARRASRSRTPISDASTVPSCTSWNAATRSNSPARATASFSAASARRAWCSARTVFSCAAFRCTSSLARAAFATTSPIVVPVVPSLVTGAVRTTVEAPRRIDVESRDDTRTAVVTDLVVSGQVTRYAVRYAVGAYNLFNWQYELPASPYASRLMPQQGRSFMFSLTLVR